MQPNHHHPLLQGIGPKIYSADMCSNVYLFCILEETILPKKVSQINWEEFIKLGDTNVSLQQSPTMRIKQIMTYNEREAL